MTSTRMKAFRPALLAALAGALAACGAPASQVDLFDRSRVHNPEALFDVESRSMALRRPGGATGRPLGEPVCVRDRDLVDYGPLTAASLRAVKAGGPSNRDARNFARAINASAFYQLVQPDAERAARDVAALRGHAEASAWLVPNPSWTNAAGSITAMGALLPTWHILRQTKVATPEDRAVIEAWLVRLAVQGDVHPGDDSIGSARGASDMMLGLMVNDPARYQKGLRTGFVAQLRDMRADGSFPNEADRGRTALVNSSRNIALLLYAAEIAASQGQNLYGASVGGKSIEDAIRFLLAAAEDNTIVDGYAAANRKPGSSYPVFEPANQVSPIDNTARAWATLYLRRHPRGALSDEIRAAIDTRGRLSNDAAGGWVSCYAAKI